MDIRRITAGILWVYMLTVSYILFRNLLSYPIQPDLTRLVTLLAFTFALLHGSQHMGWNRVIWLLTLTLLVSLLFESVGVATGWVYGSYEYTDRLGEKFLGLVPYIIPIAWFMMTYPAYVIAEQIVPIRMKIWYWRLVVATVGAVIMTAWDLAMDPLMVEGGYWVWQFAGDYFGVPLQNFWGWWLTSFVTFTLFSWLGRTSPTTPNTPEEGFIRLAIWSYAITGLTSIILDLNSGLAGPGLVGLFAMSPWVLISWLRTGVYHNSDQQPHP